MITMRKWSANSDVDVVPLAEELEQLLLAVYEVSPWTADQVAEVLRSDVNSCAPVSYTHLTLPTTPYV